jgi:hypothetical protein
MVDGRTAAPEPVRRRWALASVLPILAAAIALLCDGAYLAVIASQGDPGIGQPVVVFVTVYVITMAAAAAVGASARTPTFRLTVLSFAAAGSYALGVLGALSLVMLPLVPAGVLLTIAAAHGHADLGAARTTSRVVVASVVAVGILVLGLFALPHT